MELLFRGIKYQHRPIALEVTEKDINGIYRGIPWKCCRYRHLSGSSIFSRTMTYRGVTYQQS
ncbi:conserved hypothetical protein [Rippkaea orientalis PCC 8801]|uniref:DUF4278 domain-containing protein n=1 Tax=Rippkaea orientalis (strain PCC 8801 / RF-1) TaxID=41431 RepID=B7K2X0_RIPO1|nr:DUF4278 domain-containing protein [Rippkaea orientalis]ACK67671.1 conserved hypothetical protein [Rippkaea orientalis PCC 8801]